MQSPNKKIWSFIGRNLLLYLLLISIAYISASSEKGAMIKLHVVYLIIAVFYVWAIIHNIILFEKLFLKRKYIAYFVSLVGGLLLLSMVHDTVGDHARSLASVLVTNLVYTVEALACYLAFKYVRERHTFYQTKAMQRDIELQQLKAHLNPHFLFNALNNIYSYTLQHNRYGDELILKLSELMRFILDCSDKPQIRISEELAFIRNYIVFERERLGERCDINCTIKEGDQEKQVTPLILFPFIENACKYGSDTIQKTQIDISIENTDQQLRLMVTNSIVNRNPPSTKTGLQNTIRRLELLYPDKHEVLITTDDNRFTVELILRYEN